MVMTYTNDTEDEAADLSGPERGGQTGAVEEHRSGKVPIYTARDGDERSILRYTHVLHRHEVTLHIARMRRIYPRICIQINRRPLVGHRG